VVNKISILAVIPVLIAMTAVWGHASDLLPDGSFDAGVSGWHLVGRGAIAHAAEGATAPGSLHIEGGLAGNSTQAIAGFCLVSLPPGQDLQFAFKVKIVAGTPTFCRFALFESERSDCLWLSLGAERRRTFFFASWNPLVQGHLLTGGATRSVEVRLHCGTAAGETGPLEVLFDDVHVITSSGLIFADDLESGNTARWSNTVP
jgi:hypothetical protein